MARQTTPADRRSEFGRWLENGRVLWAYLGFAAVLFLLTVVVAGALASPRLLPLTLLGVAGFVVGVARQRPDLPVGWWLTAAGAAVGGLAAAAVTEGAWLTGTLGAEDWLAATLAALAFGLLVAGLAVLGRLGGRSEPADMLDAAMIALATFLLLFALVIHPVTPAGELGFVSAVIFPTGTLLVLVMACRILLSARVPTVAVGLLMLAMLALTGATAGIMASSLAAGTFETATVTGPLWVVYSVLLGAAGLHPSLARTRRRQTRRRDPLSRRRVLMFAALALVAPLAWGLQRALEPTAQAFGWLVPLVTSGIMLLLPLARLALTAGVAQRRADELAHRSEALAAAVEEQQDLQRQLRYQAMHDPLTGLVNRLVLAERMEWAVARPAGSRQYALVVVNLDRFKEINDVLGHQNGDELLVAASHRILEQLPANGMVARMSGDEFATVLEGVSPQEAVDWAERLRRSLRRPFRVAGHDLIVSASVGVLTTDPLGPVATPSDLLRDADLAVQAAKAAGGNRVTVFQPELRDRRLDVSRLSTRLREAIVAEELDLHYQPVVDLATDRIIGVEALLRWTPAGQAPVPPSTFIPIAEETDLIGRIGAWVVRRACREAAGWYQAHGITMSVNVSGRQLDDPGFADLVLSALREAGLPGEALILEITESSLVATSGASRAMDQLRRVREHGVRIAIDDFGTGYSSLSYVGRLPVDMVKIDSSFIRTMPRPDASAKDWAFTRAVLHLVEAMRLPAVAEGVEHREQAVALRALRCPYAQGYLYGRPMPRTVLEERLASSLSRT